MASPVRAGLLLPIFLIRRTGSFIPLSIPFFQKILPPSWGKLLDLLSNQATLSIYPYWLALFLNFSVRRKKSGSAPLRDGGEVAKNQHEILLEDLSLWFDIIRLKGRLSYLTEQGQLGMAR